MLFLIHERSARYSTNKNMGFDRDEFDNEINNAQEHTTNTENTTEISNTADEVGIDTQSEQKDIDSIIKRHTDSLAKAAENIAKNETESDRIIMQTLREIVEKLIEELSQKMYEQGLLPHSLKKSKVRVRSERNQK